MQKSLLCKVLVVGIILFIIGAGVFLYTLTPISEVKKQVKVIEPTVPITQVITKTYNQMKEEGLLEQMKVVDDRISPYENQALILEILRIRHRGLLEKLLEPGKSWSIKPQFYFISEMDGMKYVSKDVGQQGRVTEVLFNTWDSMFQENKVVRTVAQEQDTAQVTLTIVEREKIGLLGLRTKDTEKDTFTVTYCFRTGRWTGDDYFGDSDGYGYYLGDTFEIWFNLYQPDYDNDYIPYWTEVNILGTDPTVDSSQLDLDGDGIPLYWEWKWGYDPFTWDSHQSLDPDMDSIPNIKEYQLEKWFANPFIENIYVEVDHMERGGWNDPPRVFYEESKQALIERFAQHNIKAFFDDGWQNSSPNGGGQAVPHYDRLSQESGMILQYYNNYFPDERKGVFIYLLLADTGGFQTPAKGNVYNTIVIPYAPLGSSVWRLFFDWAAYGKVPTKRGERVGEAGVTLHELGHFGGLVQEYFGGADMINYSVGGATLNILQGKEFRETWGKYHSVMNYAYTYRTNLLDYSHGQNGPPYDQNDWANFHLGGWSRTSLEVEESYNVGNSKELVSKNISLIETPPITGYVYDQNLTEEFKQQVGNWSPNTRWNVEWSVHRFVKKEQYPLYHDIKVLVRPRDIASKYHSYWSLYLEGDFDAEGNISFAHSFSV